MIFLALNYKDYWPYFDGLEYAVTSFTVEHSLDGLSTASINIPTGIGVSAKMRI